MQGFTFHCPTDIVFGRGAEDHVAEKAQACGAKKAFLIYGGGSVVKSGLLAKVERILDEAGIAHVSMGGVKPNPRLSLVREAIAKGKQEGVDLVLAVGAGSVLDTAKAVAHGIANPDNDVWDFWSGKAKLTKTLPIGSILTLSATGSELSDSAVITNEETGKKGGLNTDLNRPAFALLNPELTFTAPKKQITCGVVDIMMHTLERYMTKVEGNALTDRIAEEILKDMIHYGPIGIANRKDYEAMSEIMWCGSLSHCGLTALGRKMDFAAHKLGHELGGKFDVTHADSLTVMWPAWAEYVYMDKPERFAEYAERVWGVDSGTTEERARAGIRKTMEFFKSLGMPTTFTELGIGVQDEETLEYLADMCTNYGKNTVATFHPIDRETALAIYKMANK